MAEALHVFMALKLKAGLAEQEQARPVSGAVVVEQLSSLDRDLLKDALGVVKRFQQLLRTRFHLGPCDGRGGHVGGGRWTSPRAVPWLGGPAAAVAGPSVA